MTAPNLPILDTNYVVETASVGTVIGRISVSDPDGDALTVSIVDAFGDTDPTSAFELVYEPETGKYKLVVRDPSKLNFEMVGSTIDLRIKVADATDSVIKDYTLTLIDVNETPTNIFISHRAVEENAATGTWVADLSGSDPDAGDLLSYSLKDAATSPFEIINNASGVYQLRVKNGSLIDYETDADKKISVTIIASDKFGLSLQKTFSLDILDVNDPPRDVTMSKTAIQELASDGTTVGYVTATDTSGETLSFSLIDDAGGRFALIGDSQNGYRVVVKNGAKLDYEQSPNTFKITVLASDGHLSTTKDFVIAVTDSYLESTLGSAEDDVFISGAGADNLAGGLGNDTFYAGAGNDILRGNDGHDVFVFNTTPNSSLNVDVISDFADSGSSSDQIWLSKAIFSKLLGAVGGSIDEKDFHLGVAAADADDRILYARGTGAIYYDPDGTGTIGATQFAKVQAFLNLTKDHFLVIA